MSRSLRRWIGIGVLLALAACPRWANAQGVLVNVNSGEQVVLPRPPGIWPPYPHPIPRPEPPPSTYKIKALDVNVNLDEQVARVQVSQSFVNTGSRAMEVCFVFPLPYDGAVDQLTLLIDGKEMPAKLLSATEARKMYEEIVRKNRDPALLEWMGAGLFKTSVFPVPPGGERKVTLRYSQLCRKWDGLTDFIFPLSTAKYTSHPVEEVKFQLSIESQSLIKNVYSPSHSVDIKRPDDKHAAITYTAKDTVPTEDFRLFYDVGPGIVGARELSYRPKADEDGYFVLLASPQIKADEGQRPNKTVVLAIDRSGSMSGEKIEQAKAAAKFVINNLCEGDTFNLIAYDDQVTAWQSELQRFNDETRKAALGFVEGVFAGGGTNINGALTTALSQLHDSGRPTFVIFLTDGIPTVGETNEAKIVANARSNNKVHARVFDFGVGYDVNSRLLDKLARENFGLSEYVRPNENIERSVSALYGRIGSPVMSDVKLTIDVDGIKPEEGAAVNRVYPKDVVDLFAGEQLVIVGRYKKPGAAKVTITGKLGGGSASEQKFEFPVQFVEHSGDESQAFVEKLWAVRRVGQILDDIDLNGKNDELVQELVTLAMKHGILTPYTSFMADESAAQRDLPSMTSAAGQRLEALSRNVDGAGGFEQRVVKQMFRSSSAPAAAPMQSEAQLGQLYQAVAADKKEADQAIQNVRQVGSKTFFRRSDRWVDSAVTADQEKQAIRVQRFSPEYFQLIEKNGGDVAKYLASDEPITVQVGAQVYRIE